MLKKLAIALLILLMLLVAAMSMVSRRAPAFIRAALQKSLGKEVLIRSIDYRFPLSFELSGFEVREAEPFGGETCFSVDQLILDASWTGLSSKKLVIDRIVVDNASVTIRKRNGKLWHLLSNAIKPRSAETNAAATSQAPASSAQAVPLSIHHFILKNSHFEFIDYDADARGFVVTLEDIDAEIRNIDAPVPTGKTSYRVKAKMPQGREERPAELSASGWTDFATRDTDANLSIRQLFLPYFQPYYSQVTAATLTMGYLDARANIRIERNDLTLNLDLEILGLLFQNYETDNQLFGLQAEEILAFLKDRSGRLKFQIVARWNLADRSVRAKDVIRKSIERSLKNTVIGNVGNILENTIQKISEKGLDQSKQEVEGTLKKIKDLFKY